METPTLSLPPPGVALPAASGILKVDAVRSRRQGPGLQGWLCAFVALAPLLYIGLEVATWIRNIPHWDEFDTVLDLLIALDQRPGLDRVGELLFAANNEHRTLLSRLLFAACYWFGGGINFAALAVVGNLSLLGALAILIAHAPGRLPRFRLAALLGATVCQLSHHENFFWGGSSIDHFLVILAVIGSLAALGHPGRGAFVVAALGGLGATFTLAHGMLVWPVGCLLLATDRRWRALLGWTAAAAVVLAGFFTGFHFNPGHPLPGLADLPTILRYWLALIGAAPALEQTGLAPWLGAFLLAAGGALRWRGLRPEERFPVAVAGWCLAALAMIAWGRSLLADPWAPLTSRYLILSSLAWALLGWVVLERVLARTTHATLIVAPVLASLLAANYAANQIHGAAGHAYAQTAESALVAYRQFGSIAAAQPLIYPDPDRADALLREAEARGLVRLPSPAELESNRPRPVAITGTHEVGDAAYFIEAVDLSADSVSVRGWAFRPAHTLRLGDISVVLRSRAQLVAVPATPALRPDVARKFQRRDAMFSGFEVRIPRQHLPAGKLQVGVGFDLDESAEFMMTAHTIDNTAQ